MSTDTIYVVNPADYKLVRDLVNQDLLLRNTVKIITDYYIPKNHIFPVSEDKLVEISERFNKAPN